MRVIKDEEFIVRWNGAASPSALAAELDEPISRLTNRASRLRRSGNELRRFGGGRRSVAAHDSEAYVKSWNRAESIEEVMKACGLSRAAAFTRASRLRQKGVEMKPFHRSGRPTGTKIDYLGLYSDRISATFDVAASYVGLTPERLRSGSDILSRFGRQLAIYLARTGDKVPLKAFQVVRNYDSAMIVRSYQYIRILAEQDPVFAGRLEGLRRVLAARTDKA